jgi:hypothetical protein
MSRKEITNDLDEKIGLTQDQSELLSMGDISSQMPVYFESTGFKVKSFSTTCAKCGCCIEGSHVHGKITHPMKCVSVVEGVAICERCGFLTQVKTRFHEDRRITFLSKQGWVVLEAKERAGIQAFITKLCALLSGKSAFNHR